MSENKKYYFLKLKEDFFKDESVILLENDKNGFLYSNILLKMYLLSLKHEGLLLLKEDVAYTPLMIATLTNHKLDIVNKALARFIELKLVEELTNGTLYMSNIQFLIGKSSTEGERKQKERKLLLEKKLLKEDEKSGHLSELCPKMSSNHPPEIRDKSIEIRDKILESEKKVEKRTNIPINIYGKYQNVVLTEEEIEELKVEIPNHYEKYIERLSEYMTSTGKNYKSHIATILKWVKEDLEKKEDGLRNYDYEGDNSL